MLSGCSKEFEQGVSDPDVVKDYNAVVRVGSSEAISELLENGNGNLTRSDVGADVEYEDNFVSLMDVCEIVDGESVTYYEANEYDELVPNTDLALLLNTKGEIQVGDTMYRITKAGTYYFDPSLRGKVDSMIDELDQTVGTAVGEWTVEVAEGIMRYNTFEQFKETIEVEDHDFYASETDNGTATRAPIIPNGYPKYYADAHTIVGEWMEDLFGRNKAYYVYFNNDNSRLKGKLYYYTYVFYSEMGLTAKYQKDQWIGWSNVEADEMRIVWADIMVEIKLPEPNPAIPAPGFDKPTCLGSYTGIVPGSLEPGRILVVGGIDVDSSSFKDAVMTGRDDIARYVDAALGAPILRDEKFSAIIFIKDRKMYTLLCKAGIGRLNAKSITQTFGSDFSFEIKIPSDPGSWRAWLESVKGKSSALPLKTGKGMVEVRRGTEWKGMVLIKRFD